MHLTGLKKLLKMGLYGYQKGRNFKEISKNKTQLMDKMHLKKVISPKRG